MKPLTAPEWLKQNYPNATKRTHCTQYMQEYAEYYAREMAIKFSHWQNEITLEKALSIGSTYDELYTQFLTEQN